MTPEQVLALFPENSAREKVESALVGARAPDRYDNAAVEFVPSDYGDAEQFAGVERVTIQFYRERLVQLGLEYTPWTQGGARWRSDDEFIARVAEVLGLPGPEAWGTNERGSRVLHCVGFEVHASNAQLRLLDPSFVQDIEERQNALQEERRRTFRP